VDALGGAFQKRFVLRMLKRSSEDRRHFIHDSTAWWDGRLALEQFGQLPGTPFWGLGSNTQVSGFELA
jgi:hypothetical protein